MHWCCLSIYNNFFFKDAVDLRENLLQVHLDADNARNTTEVSINLVLSIENLAIERFINDTVSNTEKASISLDTSLFNRRLQTVLHMHLIYYSYLISAYVHVIMLLIYITARILLEVCDKNALALLIFLQLKPRNYW